MKLTFGDDVDLAWLLRSLKSFLVAIDGTDYRIDEFDGSAVKVSETYENDNGEMLYREPTWIALDDVETLHIY